MRKNLDRIEIGAIPLKEKMNDVPIRWDLPAKYSILLCLEFHFSWAIQIVTYKLSRLHQRYRALLESSSYVILYSLIEIYLFAVRFVISAQ